MLSHTMSRSASSSEEVSRRIQLVLWHFRPRPSQAERRHVRRYPFPYPIRLWSVDELNQPYGDPIVVLGKDLSERGLGFYHNQPLADRKVLAHFDCGAFEARFLMELTWCRFGNHGLFENGGHFLDVCD